MPSQLVPQPLDALDVVLLVEGEVDAAVARRAVTRLSGSGRSSPHSQKSTAWWASTSNGISGDTLPAQRGASAADLLGVGLAEHLDAAERVVPVVGARGTSRCSASVFWNRVGFGSFDTAISARLLCRM